MTQGRKLTTAMKKFCMAAPIDLPIKHLIPAPQDPWLGQQLFQTLDSEAK
jgi:hypothetical protein